MNEVIDHYYIMKKYTKYFKLLNKIKSHLYRCVSSINSSPKFNDRDKVYIHNYWFAIVNHKYKTDIIITLCDVSITITQYLKGNSYVTFVDHVYYSFYGNEVFMSLPKKIRSIYVDKEEDICYASDKPFGEGGDSIIVPTIEYIDRTNKQLYQYLKQLQKEFPIM